MCSGKTGIRLITAVAKIAFPGLAKGQKIKERDAVTRVLPGNLWVVVVMEGGGQWLGTKGVIHLMEGKSCANLLLCRGFIPGQSRPPDATCGM